MALILSAATGNFNAGATWVGGVVPTVGDEARASTGHTITITANATCDEVSNAGTGIFTLNDGVTLTANVSHKSITANSVCLQFTASSPASGFIVGNLTGSATGQASTQPTAAASVTSSGTLTITGNCTGGIGNFGVAARNTSTGTLSITGNVIGGSGSGAFGANNSTGNLNATGNVTGGGSVGINNAATGIVVVTGICTGSAAGAAGANNASTGTVRATRSVGNAYGPSNSAGLVASVGVSNVALGICEIEQLEYGTFGQPPTSGTGIRLKKASSNVAVFNFCDTAGAKTLIDATANAAMPAATDVRNGVSYASGALTGSCAVPAAGSVALGVPVGAGFGTAVLTPEAVWGHASRTITEGGITAADVWSAATRTITGGTVTTLTNAPTVPTAAAIATQVRTELTTELGRIDTNVGSRAASGTLASDVTAIKAKTDAVNVDRINNTATTAIVGNLLAQANS